MSGSPEPHLIVPLTVLVVQPEGDLYGACRSMLRTLSALPRGSVRPIVCFPWEGSASTAYRASGFDVEIVPCIAVLRRQGLRPAGLLRLLFDIVRSGVSLARVGRRHRVDLVHSNSAFVIGGWSASMLLRKPHVWHIREVVTDKPQLVRVLAFVVKRGAKVAAVVSRAAAGMLAADQPLVVVPNGYRAEPEPEPATGRGIDGRHIVLSLGRISSTKGQQLLVEAFAGLPPAVRDSAELWIAGTVFAGNESAAEALLERVADLSLGDTVRFLGYVPDPRTLLDRAHVLCVTTRTGEGFANVALEAMTHGVVVIAASRGGIEELVRDGSSGLMAEPGNKQLLADALEGVLSDPVLHAQLVAGGHRVASRFTPEASARCLLEVWKQAN